MHIALRNMDLLYQIFHFLDPALGKSDAREELGPSTTELQLLLNAALTCKTFSEPAFKHLWAHVPTFDVLLGLLPSAKLVSDIALPDSDQPQSPTTLDRHDLIWVGSSNCITL